MSNSPLLVQSSLNVCDLKVFADDVRMEPPPGRERLPQAEEKHGSLSVSQPLFLL
ncbi:hypothetical protein AX14_004009 [Amanita brunnescens Koide BX004]|nr:hypothetical protein AX14_004009 [Amanita brunnescens Koide BX004]